MAARLGSRVARLERARSPGCPVCGGGGPEVYEVVVPLAAERVDHAPAARAPAACGNCGRPTRFWITLPPARGG
jgi:flavin-dependent dehydrogenase